MIMLHTGRENGQVWVEITDTGNGIPEENLKRIFDPIFTTKPVGKGTAFRVRRPLQQPEIAEQA